MHPKAFEEYQKIKARLPNHWALGFLQRAQHFLVTEAMHKLAIELHAHEYDSPDEYLSVPVTSRCPGPEVVLVLEEEGGSHAVVFCYNDRNDKCASLVSCALVRDGLVFAVGSFEPGSDYIQRFAYNDIGTKAGSAALTDGDVEVLVVRLAYLLSLINEPRKVARRPETVSRQQRRLMERTIGAPIGAYFSVGWEIGKAVHAKMGISTEGHRQALHWRRAHWAIAKQGQPKAEWVNLPNKGGWGWYRWVSDCWKGHPDFGVRLHHYEPRLKGEEKRPGALGCFAASSPDRLAMMDAAKRSALVQSEFAA